MQLETERLKIVSFKPELFVPLYQLFCENQTVMQSAFKGRVLSQKEFLDVLANDFILDENAQIGFVCILDKTTGNFIGFTGLIPCNFLGDEDDLEFGFVLHQNHWGKGFATEIGQFWIDFAENELQLDRILAAASPDNHASIKAIKKLGLTEVKEISTEDRGSRLVFSKEFKK
ncbi:GNAT family N-acetyltransferase [Zunongwangia endophytica]|uniref:GNAT family N-acetyltransferase n=1 Tax=Zunongwangia endophytica TaxID=1808945 RepID=A0ABV8H3Q3_9FLAO|nr:GNAT family N-acetyltransferase [Zunongwangia endophytica]MDN3595994.1 GNAT family N-acetyltransferase [Zunongwangia endophytica]